MQGASGLLKVNGVDYQGVMPPPMGINDQQVADVMTYVRNSWGNRGEPVSARQANELRAATLN